MRFGKLFATPYCQLTCSDKQADHQGPRQEIARTIIRWRASRIGPTSCGWQWVPGHAEIEVWAAGEFHGDSESRRFCHGQAWPTLRGRQPRQSREERRSRLKQRRSYIPVPQGTEERVASKKVLPFADWERPDRPLPRRQAQENRLGPMLVVRDRRKANQRTPLQVLQEVVISVMGNHRQKAGMEAS